MLNYWINEIERLYFSGYSFKEALEKVKKIIEINKNN